jgi:protocatechuate 3,4-dioxygenase beta subunit
VTSSERSQGAVLRRREAIAALGALGVGAGIGLWRATRGNGQEMAADTSGGPEAGAADHCVLTPEQTEGPYYISGEPFRRNIAEGRPGLPLELELTAQDAASCKPLKGATVEIWHADALGAYSGFNEPGSFLRGQQRTDRDGKASFKTIYPGWYTGRTVHIHVKVHASGSTVHTGQLYFDDSLTDSVFAEEAPYNTRGARDTRNATDSIYASGGAESTLKLRRARNRKGKKKRGYEGRFALGVT